MSCRGHGHHDDENCVCGVLRAIADAQDQVDPINDCDVSCDRSIRELLAGVVSPTNGFDTIPVILYCGGSCEPFLGFGTVTRGRGSTTGNLRLDCVRTFYFRVHSVDDNCCAKLELLVTERFSDGKPDPCDQIYPSSQETPFIGTGTCITVDLSCFCGVTCLDPVRVRRD